MTYREQIDQALATFEKWPKNQQDVYLRMLDDLKAKLELHHCQQAKPVDYAWCDGVCDD